MASIVVTDPAGKRAVFELSESNDYSAGRSHKNDIVVADDLTMLAVQRDS